MISFRTRRPLVASFLVACVFAAPPVRADGECFGGYRDTTVAERSAMSSALATARDALPAAPDGWVLERDDTLSIIESLCRDYDTGSWSYGHQRYYQRVDDIEARDQALRAAAGVMKADVASKQSRLDAVTARVEELSRQLVTAAERENYAKIDELNLELDAASNEYLAILGEGDADEQMQSAQVEAYRDSTMSVVVYFNATHDAPGYGARDWPLAGVAAKSFRWSEDDESMPQDYALVLIGDWAASGDGSYEFTPDAAQSPTAVQSITLRISADAGRIGGVVKAIDFDALQGLLVTP